MTRLMTLYNAIKKMLYLLALKLLRLDPVSDGVTAIGTTPLVI